MKNSRVKKNSEILLDMLGFGTENLLEKLFTWNIKICEGLSD